MLRATAIFTLALLVMTTANVSSGATLQAFARVNLVAGSDARLYSETGTQPAVPLNTEDLAPASSTAYSCQVTGPAGYEVALQISRLEDGAAWGEDTISCCPRIEGRHDADGALHLDQPLQDLSATDSERVVISIIYE